MSVLCFQELLVILFPVIVVIPSAQKIRIMTATAALTVLCPIKEPGGTIPVMLPTWMVCVITENTRQELMVSTGITGKDITTPPRELRWKSDQLSFCSLLVCWVKVNQWLEKECSSDWLINKTEKYFLISHFVLFFIFPSFHSFAFLVSCPVILFFYVKITFAGSQAIIFFVWGKTSTNFEHTLRTLTELIWFLKRGTLAWITHF